MDAKMDAKIKKYARYLGITAWILMIWSIALWVMKWIADWVFCGCVDLSKYTSMAEAFEKLPSGSEQLWQLKFIDTSLSADLGGAWIGLANLAKLSWGVRLWGFLFDGVAIGILAVGFWFFIKLMAQFKNGSVFSIDVIELLSKLAKVIFWFALYVPVNRAIVSLIIMFQNPSGQRFFVPSYMVGDAFILAASYFFMILTSLIYESCQLKEEHDLTI